MKKQRALRITTGSAIAALIILLAAGCGSDTPVQDGNAEATLDRAALASQFQATLDSLYEAAQETEENFPGATAAYILPDGEVFSFATGFSDVDDEIPMTADLRMPSGSIGKTYVAAVALQLAHEGALDLDAPLATYLGEEPWFDRVPNSADLTVRILLNHTGGMIQPYFENPDFAAMLRERRTSGDRDDYLAPVELVSESVLDAEPLFAAGEGYRYTDIGYILAGLAMEAATGETYYGLLQRLFLEPLDLNFTLPADRRDLPNLAQGYAHESSELFGLPLEVIEEGLLVIHPLGEWTGGGLVNNPQHLVRWGKLLWEGEAVGGDDLPQLLRIGVPADPEKPDEGYGLGVFIRQTEDGPVYGHGGFYPGYNSQLVYFPDFGIAVSLQINSDASNSGEHVRTLAGVVLDALQEGEEQPAA